MVFVKDIMYVKKETPANNLLMYAIVDFDNMYTGESFLEMIKTNVGRYQSNLQPLHFALMIRMSI